jgi:hypothetical protein
MLNINDVEYYNRAVFFAVKARDLELSRPMVLFRGGGAIQLEGAEGTVSLVTVPEVLDVLEDGCGKFPYLSHQVGERVVALRQKYNRISVTRRSVSAIGISLGALCLAAGALFGASSLLTTQGRDYTGAQWLNETRIAQNYSHSRFVGSYLSGSNL